MNFRLSSIKLFLLTCLLLIGIFTVFGCSNNPSLKIVSITSPVGRGQPATLVAKTSPYADCKITAYYLAGPDEPGLYPKQADSKGNVSWTWTIGNNTLSGTYQIIVDATVKGKSISQTISFRVS